MKRQKQIALAALLVTASASAIAADTANSGNTATVSGNLAATSTYVWRGLPQTVDAALQGGIDYIASNGPHASAWTSNVAAGSELDLSLGYSGVAAKGIQFDVGFIMYLYPQYEAAASANQDFNFNEIYAQIGKDALSARFSSSPDAGDYLEVNAMLEKVAAGWDLGVHFGSYSVDKDFTGLPGEDYTDYNVSLGNKVGDFDLTFSLSDTDLKDDSYRTIITLARTFKP
jgi:uncharacterized protein (TIGR02001 family)